MLPGTSFSVGRPAAEREAGTVMSVFVPLSCWFRVRAAAAVAPGWIGAMVLVALEIRAAGFVWGWGRVYLGGAVLLFI